MGITHLSRYQQLPFSLVNCIDDGMFSMEQQLLCQYIYNEIHITGAQHGSFWTALKDTMKCMIEKQCTNATSGCKRAFQGKSSPVDLFLLKRK